MNLIKGFIINHLGRMIISAAVNIYILFIEAIFVIFCVLMPFFPDFFSSASQMIVHDNAFSSFLQISLIGAFAIRITLLIILKLENLAINSQQNPDLKFKGQNSVLSFMLPFVEIGFFLFILYYWDILSGFDFDESGSVYAQTLIEMLRSKKMTLIWVTAFIAQAFSFAKGLPESLHSLGFSTDPSHTHVRYIWRILVFLCVFSASISLFYCTETDLLFDIHEEPMVIIR